MERLPILTEISLFGENGQNVEVSYVGYTTQVIPYTGQDSLEVTLQEDLTELQEIVVTGYGTQKKANVTVPSQRLAMTLHQYKQVV